MSTTTRRPRDQTFEVVGDASTATLEPPTHHLLNEDVMEIMMEAYPTLSKEELTDSVAADFFGTWKGARDYILNYENLFHLQLLIRTRPLL
jgi:hypothetical protein